MNGFDLIILAALILFAFLGYHRGLVKSVLSLVNWVIAGFVAWTFSPVAASLMEGMFNNPTAAMVAGFIILFLLTYMLGIGASIFLSRAIHSTSLLKVPDKVLGTLFGVASASVVVTFAFLVMGLTTAPQQDWWQNSFLVPYYEGIAIFVSDFLPESIVEHIEFD